MAARHFQLGLPLLLGELVDLSLFVQLPDQFLFALLGLGQLRFAAAQLLFGLRLRFNSCCVQLRLPLLMTRPGE